MARNKNEDKIGLYERARHAVSDFFYDASVDLHELTKKNKKPKDLSEIALKSSRKRARRIELLCIWAVLIIPLIDLAIFWVYGTIQSIPIAFEEYPVEGGIRYSFFNFRYIIDELRTGKDSLIAFLNTLKYWTFGFFVLTPISFMMGYFLYKKIFGFRFFRYVFFIPSLMSSVIVAAFFKYLMGVNGLVPYLVDKLFGVKDVMFLADSRYAFGTMLFYNFYTGLTGNMLYWMASMARIPNDVIEAGRLDGLTTMGEFRHITFPIVWPFLATMLMLQFTGILSAGGPALLLTKGQFKTTDLGYYEYVLTTGGNKQSQGVAGAIGLIKGFLILPFTMLIYHFVNKIETVEF